ncbi:MAG: hypothetical protein J4F28_09495 [Nitrosopumilaceae archaeon]|nr:hypothetical protein [Nitrosopumilaceae archaeon]
MPYMVLSEKDPEDKQKMKNGVIGVVVLLVLGSLSPLIIEEFTNVDLETLCEKNQNGTDIECLDEGGIKSTVLEGLGYVSIIIAIVGFVGFVIVGVKASLCASQACCSDLRTSPGGRSPQVWSGAPLCSGLRPAGRTWHIQ